MASFGFSFSSLWSNLVWKLMPSTYFGQWKMVVLFNARTLLGTKLCLLPKSFLVSQSAHSCLSSSCFTQLLNHLLTFMDLHGRHSLTQPRHIFPLKTTLSSKISCWDCSKNSSCQSVCMGLSSRDFNNTRAMLSSINTLEANFILFQFVMHFIIIFAQ